MKTRTTIQLDSQLLSEAKQFAARTQRTLAAVVEDALRVSLYQSTNGKMPRRVKLPISRRRPGLRPGIDLDHSAALWDLLDSDHDSARR